MDSPLISRTSSQAIIRILAKQKPGLKIIHLNAQSLAKIEEFRFLFINSNIDVICVSETWFVFDVSNMSMKILIFFAPIVVVEVEELLFIYTRNLN